MRNRDLIQSALKRVSALTGCDGKLYYNAYGWSVVFDGHRFDESVMSAGELLAYLHGIEDAFKFNNNK